MRLALQKRADESRVCKTHISGLGEGCMEATKGRQAMNGLNESQLARDKLASRAYPGLVGEQESIASEAPEPQPRARTPIIDAKRRSRETGAPTGWPQVSVIIPTLNEAQNLPHVFAKLSRDLHEGIV